MTPIDLELLGWAFVFLPLIALICYQIRWTLFVIRYFREKKMYGDSYYQKEEDFNYKKK
jgi:hypothetical protein